MPFTTAAYPATGPLSLRRRGLGGELIDEVGLLLSSENKPSSVGFCAAFGFRGCLACRFAISASETRSAPGRISWSFDARLGGVAVELFRLIFVFWFIVYACRLLPGSAILTASPADRELEVQGPHRLICYFDPGVLEWAGSANPLRVPQIAAYSQRSL